jgi:hypothetical protein
MNRTKPWRVCVLAALMLPGWAIAAGRTPPAQALGTVEAILLFCAERSPEGADHYRGQAKLLTQGADEETLAEVRAQSAYQLARDIALESLAKVSEQDAHQACSQSLAQNQ